MVFQKLTTPPRTVCRINPKVRVPRQGNFGDMRRKDVLKRHHLALAIALTFAACGGSSSPTSATVIAVPAGTTNWLVTQRFISVSGPDNCWVREQRARWTGAVFAELPMVVTRTGSSIAITGDFFQVNYVGTANGNAFATVGVAPLEGGGAPCQDGASFTQMAGVSLVSGTFSDDQTLRATEVNSYPLTSGGTVTYTWDWQATRRN